MRHGAVHVSEAEANSDIAGDRACKGHGCQKDRMVREASSAVPQSCSKIPQQLQIRADVRCEQQMRLLSQAGPAPDGALNALRAALRKATPAKAMAWPFRDAAVQGILRFFASQEQAVVQDGLRVVLHHLEALASRSKKILPPTETCAMRPSRAAQAVPGPRVPFGSLSDSGQVGARCVLLSDRRDFCVGIRRFLRENEAPGSQCLRRLRRRPW